MQNAGRALAAPVAAVLIGAAGLPGVAGAQTAPPLSTATPVSTESTELAKTPSSVAVSGASTPLIAAGPVALADLQRAQLHAQIGTLRADAARMGWQIDPRSLDRAAARAAFEAVPPSGVREKSLLSLGDVVDRIESLAERAASPALLADLDRVLTQIGEIRSGPASVSLPELSEKVTGPSAPSVPGLGTVPKTTIPSTAPTVTRPGAKLLESLWSASQLEFSTHAAEALTTYTEVANGLNGLTARLPNLALQSQVPLIYSDAGLDFFVPAGATLVVQDGQFGLLAPGLMLSSADGLAVVADSAQIQLGEQLDGLSAAQVLFRNGDTSGRLEGFTGGVSRAEGAAVLRADHLSLDLPGEHAVLDGAELRIGADGVSTLEAARAQLDGPRGTMSGSDLRMSTSATGTELSVGQGALSGPDGDGSVSQLQLRLVDGQAHIGADALNFTDGNLSFAGEAVLLDAERLSDGGHRVVLGGRDLSFGQGDLQIANEGDGRVEVRLDASGQLRQLDLQGDALRMSRGAEQAEATGGTASATFGENGRLRQLALAADAASYSSPALSGQVQGGRLDARFAADGTLRSLDGRGEQLAFSDGQGSLTGTTGTVSARAGAAGLESLDMSLRSGTWSRGAERVALDEGRARLGFEAGVLSSAELASGHLVADLAGGRQLDIEGSRAQASLTDGVLRQLELSSGAARFSDGDTSVSLAGLGLSARFDAAGNLNSAEGRAAELSMSNGAGQLFAAGEISLASTLEGGALRELAVRGREISYRDPSGQLGALDAAEGKLVAAFDADGQVSRIDLATRDANLAGDFGTLGLGGVAALETRFDAGQLSGVEVSAESLRFDDGAQQLDLQSGWGTLALDDGELRNAGFGLESGRYASARGTVELTGGSELSLTRGADGAMSVEGAVAALELANAGGRLELEGARFSAASGADGTLSELEVRMDRGRYAGTAQGGRDFAFDLVGPALTLGQRAEGGQRLSFDAAGTAGFAVDGHQVGLEGAQHVLLETTADGQVDRFAADFPGLVEWTESASGNGVRVKDLGLEYDREPARVALDFTEADVALRSEGLSAHIEGANAELDSRRMFVALDAAELQRTMGEELGLTVEDFRLELLRDESGALESGSVELSQGRLQTGGALVTATTESGDRVRLDVGAEDGRLRFASLEIPEGGRVNLSRDDLEVGLGGQRLAFSETASGRYRFEGQSLDIDARTRDAEVQVKGGDARVSIDPATGGLFIEDIRGVDVDLKTQGVDLSFNLEQVRGFMARAVGYEGGATGGALHLIPTEDGANLTARVRGEVQGLPVELRFSDVHQLAAIAQLSTNQAHIYLGDVSGQGETQIGVGPLTLKGSAIELVGRYHTFDAGRFLSSADAFASTGGKDLFSGFAIEPNGALRFGTDRSGLNAELSVILPRYDAAPGYRFQIGDRPASAPGAVLSFGYQNDDFGVAAFAGALPGSHATLGLTQGEAELGGVDLPKRVDLPTTAVAGLRLGLADVGDDARLGATVGAFANPAAFGSSQWLREDVSSGGFVGLEYTRDNLSVSGGAVMNVTNGNPELGSIGVRLGLKW